MTTLTTPEALAVLDAEIDRRSRYVNKDFAEPMREARAHLASRIAELEGELAAVRTASQRVLAAFRAHGKAAGIVDDHRTRLECEAAMLNLEQVDAAREGK